MKQYWNKLALKIDALSLRERCIIFIAVAFAIVSIINSFVLEPQFAQQKKLSQQIKQDQTTTGALHAEMLQKVQSRTVDPDAAEQAQLQQLKQQVAQFNESLQSMQKGLVPPERMAVLLQDILKRDASLRLMSLKSLPVSALFENANSAAAVSAATVSTAGREASPATTIPDLASATTVPVPLNALIYRHGVELVVQGSYLDMLHYMAQLETMPMQVFWGKAQLQVDEYPQATLRLTLYTLSLDKKWLNL